MKNIIIRALVIALACLFCAPVFADTAGTAGTNGTAGEIYTVGVDDVIEIAVLRPEALNSIVTVAPDGTVTFPYIGMVKGKGEALHEIQATIKERLSDGYMKYPVVTVTLTRSLSRKFFVYGEVIRPGNYPMDENTTVLRAITIAGGFTKFGSTSKVKILRQRKEGPGYEPIKVNIKGVMKGDVEADIELQPGDMVVVSEGVF